MPKVWFAIPSKRPPAEVLPVLAKWRQMGYAIALWRDAGDEPISCDLWADGTTFERYPGYAQAVNFLVKSTMEYDSGCQWIVTGGDDTLPDPDKRADEIAAECSAHFRESNHLRAAFRLGFASREEEATFGVMQPTGDRFAGGSIDRICGSPWIGRSFCERAYGGNGPYWPEYRHMFLDEELQEVAIKLGVFWQRPDLTHLHQHFMRESLDINSPAIGRPVPEFLREANSPEHWQKFRALFERRKAAGFPGHEPQQANAA